MPRRSTDSQESDIDTGVSTKRKGQRQDSQHATVPLDLTLLRSLPPPLKGDDGKTTTTSTSKKRPRTNTTIVASDAHNLNPNSNSNPTSKPRKPTSRPPDTRSPTPEITPDTRTQQRGKGSSKLPIASTSASRSSKGKHALNDLIDGTRTPDTTSMTAGTDSPNPRARKVQRLNGHPPLPPISSTPQRKKPPRTPKNSSNTATSVFMNLGGRRLSTPLRMSPPTVDLTASPPPASPSDDPILLVGPELDRARRRSRNKPGRQSGAPRQPRPSFKLEEDGDSIMHSYDESSTAIAKNEGGTSVKMDVFSPGQALARPVPKEEPVSPIRRSFPPPTFDTSSPPRENGGPSADSSLAMDEDTDDDSYSANDLGFIGPEFTVPIRQGSPSPPTLHRRSFTKLGQRKPTPRRLVLEGEGDVSMMAKTVYYEHGEDQVEPPSPSPMSRRRAKKTTLVDQDEPADEVEEDGAALGSPSPYPRILDGLDASHEEEDAQAETSAEMGVDERGYSKEPESDASGYVHDPTGFEVLKEIPPDPLPDSVDLPPATTTEEKNVPPVLEEPSFEEDDPPLIHQTSEIPEAPIVEPIHVPTRSLTAPSENVRRSESRALARDSVLSHSETSLAPRSLLRQSDEERDDNRGRKGALSQGLTQSSDVRPRYADRDRRDTEEDTEDEDHSSYEFDDDSPVVEVSSTNPRAAARAAVILKMHHAYIVEDGDQSIADGRSGRSRSRRSSIAWDGSRSSRRAISRSRSRDAGVGNVSTISLPDLLQEAEQEVLNNSIIIHPPTPSKPSAPPLKSSSLEKHPSEGPTSSDPRNSQHLGVPAAWSKEDWKNMERCFVKERKLCAQRFSLASSNDVDPNDVDLEAVVDRFQAFLEKSTPPKLGTDWERENLVLRAMALQKRLLKVIANKRFVTPVSDNRVPPPDTPSTFGDEYEYDRSSRQSSMRRSSSVQSMPLSLHAPQYAHLLEEAKSIASSRPRNLQFADRKYDSSYSSAGPSSAARFSDAYGDPGRQSYQRASSSGHSAHGSETSFKVPEMSQVHRDRPLSLVEPLRRASSAPMRDPEVSISREYEEFPELRHLDTLPRHLPPPTSIPLPSLNHVSARSSTVPISIPSSRLRKVSSSSSVKDLVRSFEDLSEEIEQEALRSTPRSQSQGAEAPISRRRADSGSSIDSSFSFRRHRETKRDDDDDDVGNDTFREMDRHASSSSSSSSALPKQRAIPPSAPPKKRLSFLNWRW